jgi:hypothetical protein
MFSACARSLPSLSTQALCLSVAGICHPTILLLLELMRYTVSRFFVLFSNKIVTYDLASRAERPSVHIAVLEY